MSSSKTLRRKRTPGKSKNIHLQDRLGPRFHVLRVEHLEARRMLSGFSALPGSLDSALAGAQSGLNNYVNAGNPSSPLSGLPVVGSQLGNQIQNALNNGNLEQAVQNVIASQGPITGTALQTSLYDALGPHGAQILGGDGWNNNTTNPNSITSEAVHMSGFGASAPFTGTVEMRLHEAIASQTVNLATLIPNLPIQFSTEGNVALSGSIDIELDIQITNGSVTGLPQAPLDHYSTVPDASPTTTPTQAQQQSQMIVSATATVTAPSNGQFLTAYVGFLQGTVTLGTANSNQLTAAVYVASLTSPTFAAQPFGGSAYLDLKTTLAVQNQTSYPSVSTEIVMNWSNLSNVSTLNVSFNQLTLNLNGFFTTYVQPILADIAQYTQPIISVYDVLNSTVPGLSSLPGPMNGFTVLDALEAAGLVTQTEAAELNAIGNFATEVQNLINDTAGVGTGGVITFGNYTFEGSALVGLPDVTTFLPGLINDIPLGPLSSLPIGNLSQYLDPTSSSNLQNIENNPAAWLQQYAQNHASQLGSALTVTDAIGNGGLIQFPVMDDPASLLGMLFGANVPLITVNTGTLDLPIDLNLNFNIPVYGLFSIGAGFDFNGSFTAEIEAGYDTQGLHDYFAGGGTNSNDLLDGFYVQGQNGADPGTNVTCNITATASFGASISVIIASASIDLTGGITADVSVGTNPTLYATGNKIYVYSSGSMRNLDDVYSLSGQISTSLDLTAKLQFLFWSQTWTIASLDPVLWDSSEFTGTGAQQPPPVIYAFSASQGPMTGGDTMTVYGMNLEGASQVIPVIDTGPYTGPGPGGGGNIDLPAVTPFNVTSTSFQITIPPSGYIYSDLLIEVLTPGGETDSINQPGQQYEYIPDPTVTKIVTLAAGGFSGPASGGAGGGTLVEIEGTGLGYVTGVNFGNVAGAIFNPPPSSPYYDYGLYAPQPGGIFVYAPAGTGTVNVTLASPGGTAVDPNAFTFVPQPQVAGVSPALGPLDVSGSAAESVTIFGQNFGYLDGNGNPVATASGVLFGYTPPASAQNIAPLATLPVLSDTYHPGIYIQGYVSIPAYWAITVKVPYSSAAGPVDVLVETTPTGFPEPIVDPTQQGVGNWSSPTSQASPASSADVFTYLAQPAITSVTPVGGPTGGGTTVTIGGTALSYASAVKFGSTPAASFTVNANGTITAASQAGSAGTVDVYVTTPGGTSVPPVDVFVDPDAFTFVTPPVFYAMSPVQSWGAWGPLSGGTQITITGKYLSSVTAVKFGSVAGTNLIINAAGTQLTVDSPAESAGTVDVKLVSLGATGGSLDTGGQFYYEGVPAVTGVTPATVDAAGNTQVTITGTGLYLASAVNFVNPQDPLNQTYAALSFTSESPTQLIATAPAGLVEAGYYEYVSVTTPAGTSPNPGTAGEVNFAHTPPTITGLSTTTGPAAGGTPVTITGTNLFGAYKVLFGSQPGTSLDYISETTISIVSPLNYPGTYPVTVLRNDGVVSNGLNFTYTPSAIITDVSPSSGLIDPGTLVTITGTNILPFEDVLDFGNIALTPLPGATETTVQVISPSPLPASYQGTTVNISIFTNYGLTPTTPADQFTYVAPLLGVTGLSATSGPVGGGTTLTISGAYLDDATAVDFGGVPGTIVPGSSTARSVEVTSPPSTGFNPGTVNVTVTGEYGTTPISAADKFTYYATGPVVSGVSPASVLVNTQTMVTISGAGLTDPDVYFGNLGATVESDSYSQIVVECPASSTPGAVNVTVVTSAGTSPIVPADQFIYGTGPTILALYRPTGGSGNVGPANFSDGGWVIEIYGANLAGATAVDVGGQTVTSFELNTATAIELVVPEEGPGAVPVTVTTPYGTSTAVPYTFTSAPVLIDFNGTTPVAPLSGGTTLMIRGVDLANATAVYFGNTQVTSLTYIPFDPSGEYGALDLTTPPGAAGIVDVTVMSPEGTSTIVSTDKFIYVPVPTVTGISPASGPLAGGNMVAIDGTGLSDVTQVDFGGVATTYVSPEDDNTIDVGVPAGVSLGTVDVIVTTVGGAATLSSAYTYLPPPVVSGLSVPSAGTMYSGSTPASGAVEGGTPVTITGLNLAGASAVDFGGNPAAILSNTASEITVTSPYGNRTGSVDVTVTTPTNGTSAISPPADQFTYTLAPYITQVTSPLTLNGNQAAGYTAGGDTVTIQGDDLSGATAMNFGNTPAASFGYDVNGDFTAVSPPGVAGTVDITVTTPVGTSDFVAADQFTYVVAPVVLGVSPSSGPIVGGTQVTITGIGLADATGLNFGPVSTFGYTITSDTDTQIVATTPAYSAGTYDVTVATQYGTSATSPADQFTYEGSPTITSQDVASGSVYGGTLVTISGLSLSNATVDFGSNQATVLSGLSTDSQIVVVSPEATGDAAGPVDVTVTTAYGTATEFGGFTYALPPAVTSISEAYGTTLGGTTLTISGMNLLGASAVDFGGVAAASFFDNGDGTLSAVSPAGSVSTVDVTVVTLGGTTPTSPADQFTYLAVPNVTGISSVAGPVTGGTAVTIFGTGLANATQVDFGGMATAGFTLNPDGSITVSSPNLGYPATVDVTFMTPAGASAMTSADQFTYTAAPGVSGLSISSGNRDGGDYVSIYGSDLDGATTVDFGAHPASIIDESAGEIDIFSPAGAVGPAVDMTVVTPGGTSPTSAVDLFSYFQAPPAVSGLSQSTGPAEGGTAITITGTDLDGATEVDFGGVAATIVPGSDHAGQITATVPMNTLGTVDVTVTTPAGTSPTSRADQFTGAPAPVVSSLGSAIGPTAGQTEVVVYGSNLAGATAVTFGLKAGSVVFDSDSYIVADSPAGATGVVDITVTTPYGTSTLSPPADQFTYVAPPTTAAASYTLTENSYRSVASPGVLAGDTDPQGLPLTATLLTSPANGTLSFGSDGSFSYTPYGGYTGPDSFTYVASNGYATSAPTTVSLTVNPPTLAWAGTQGNWTDYSWGTPSSYPDYTVNATVAGLGSVVTVAGYQEANALAVQGGGQVAIGPGAVLSVITGTSVTGDGMVSVDPNGYFSTGGIFTLDSGSVTGGPVSAAAYQLNAGLASAALSGLGGVTKDTAGTVILSGVNSYLGGTVVDMGTLVAANANSLPVGSSLTVGVGAGMMFGPAQSASPVLPATAAPVIAAVSENSPLPYTGEGGHHLRMVGVRAGTAGQSTNSPRPYAGEGQGVRAGTTGHAENLSHAPAISPAAIDAVLTSPVLLPSLETSWDSADQNQSLSSNAETLDAVLARFGVGPEA